jgi:gas vesicle protein
MKISITIIISALIALLATNGISSGKIPEAASGQESAGSSGGFDESLDNLKKNLDELGKQLEELAKEVKRAPEGEKIKILKKELLRLQEEIKRSGEAAREKIEKEVIPRLKEEIERLKEKFPRPEEEKPGGPVEI